MTYWSSSTYAVEPGFAWVVDFSEGHVTVGFKTGTYAVREVRGGS